MRKRDKLHSKLNKHTKNRGQHSNSCESTLMSSAEKSLRMAVLMLSVILCVIYSIQDIISNQVVWVFDVDLDEFIDVYYL